MSIFDRDPYIKRGDRGPSQHLPCKTMAVRMWTLLAYSLALYGTWENSGRSKRGRRRVGDGVWGRAGLYSNPWKWFWRPLFGGLSQHDMESKHPNLSRGTQ